MMEWNPGLIVLTDAKASTCIAVTQDQKDLKQLEPAMETVQHFTGRTPQRLIAEGGYATRSNIQAMAPSAGHEMSQHSAALRIAL